MATKKKSTKTTAKSKAKKKTTKSSKALKSKKGKSKAKLVLVSDQDGSDVVTLNMSKYAEYVTEERALQRIEDGLKPVHRHILWASLSVTNARTNFTKSAKIVGDTMGNFHPHGDSAIYDALVGMVNSRHPAIEGQGNFGGPTTPAAAYRYTEARLSAFIRTICMDTPDMQVVPTEPSFDNKLRKPVYLPMRLPFILLNGGAGIAVGVNSGIPPHNAKEVIDAVITTIETGDAKKGAKKIKGPDYGMGSIVSPKGDISNVYKNGDGTLEYTCTFNVEKKTAGKKTEQRLVVTSFAPEFNVPKFMEKLSDLEESKSILYVRDETSGKNGTRVVIAFDNPSAVEQYVIPLLRRKINYKFNVLFPTQTKLSEQGVDELDEENVNKKRVKIEQFLALPTILDEWVKSRKRVVKATLKKALQDLRIEKEKEEGKKLARDNIDKLLKIIKSGEEMVPALQAKLKMTPLQAETVAAMRVDTLQKSSQEKIAAKISDLKKKIAHVQKQLKDIPGVVVQQLKDIEAWMQKNVPALLVRGTKLSVRGADLSQFKSDLKFVLWDPKTADKADKEPPMSALKNGVKKPKGLVPYRDTLTLVYSDSNAISVNAGSFRPSSYLKQGEVVGIAGDECTAIAMADNAGKVLVIDREQKAAADEYFEVVKTEEELSFAVGMNAGVDRLVLRLDKGDLIVQDASATKVKRRNSKPSSVGRSRNALKGMYALPPDCILVTSRGAKVKLPKTSEEAPTARMKLPISKARNLFVVSMDENFVVYNGTGGKGKGKGKRVMLDYKKTMAEIKNGNVAYAFPVASTGEEEAEA